MRAYKEDGYEECIWYIWYSRWLDEISQLSIRYKQSNSKTLLPVTASLAECVKGEQQGKATIRLIAYMCRNSGRSYVTVRFSFCVIILNYNTNTGGRLLCFASNTTILLCQCSTIAKLMSNWGLATNNANAFAVAVLIILPLMVWTGQSASGTESAYWSILIGADLPFRVSRAFTTCFFADRLSVLTINSFNCFESLIFPFVRIVFSGPVVTSHPNRLEIFSKNHRTTPNPKLRRCGIPRIACIRVLFIRSIPLS